MRSPADVASVHSAPTPDDQPFPQSLPVSGPLDLIETTAQEVRARGEGRVLGLTEYATAVLYNGLGHYDAALAATARVRQHDDLGTYGWELVELIEAAARGGRTEAAAARWTSSPNAPAPAEPTGRWAWGHTRAHY